MCNLSKGIEDRGIQKGIPKGIQEGEILGTVKAYRGLNIPEKDIAVKIQEMFSLTGEEAERYTAADPKAG